MPGTVILDMPFDEYKSIDAMNASNLKILAKSARAFSLRKNKADTASLILGRAIHEAVLEPDLFSLSMEEKGVTKTSIQASECCTSLLEHRKAKEIVENGRREVTILWDYDGELCPEMVGMKCKARLDVFSAKDRGDGTGIIDAEIADLKSVSGDISPEKFANDCCSFGYDIQAYWYIISVMSLGKYSVGKFSFIPVSTRELDVAIFTMSEEFIEFGKKRTRAALCNYVKYLNGETGHTMREPVEIYPPLWFSLSEGEDEEYE